MKKNILLNALVGMAVTSYGQEDKFTLSGSYAFANLEETDTDSSGFIRMFFWVSLVTIAFDLYER